MMKKRMTAMGILVVAGLVMFMLIFTAMAADPDATFREALRTFLIANTNGTQNIDVNTAIVAVVDVNGGAIDGATLGVTTPSSGKFTTLETTGGVTLPVIAAANATNGQAVTLGAVINQLASVNGANNGTNTITLDDPTTAGQMGFIVNTGTSNLLAIAKTGNFKSAAVELAVGDAMIVFATATNEWRGIEQ